LIRKDLAERGRIRTPGTGFSQYNGLANSPFHCLVFGINSLHSGELPYFGARCPGSGAIVQLPLVASDPNSQPAVALLNENIFRIKSCKESQFYLVGLTKIGSENCLKHLCNRGVLWR